MRENLHRELMPEMNRSVGEAWGKGGIAIRDEHLYSETVQALVRESLASLAHPEGTPRTLLTTVTGEAHMLGLLMLEAVMSLEQACCISLGPQSPLEEIARAAPDFQGDIVALSFSVVFPKKQILPMLRVLRSALPPEVKLWAGGAAVSDLDRTPRGVVLLPLLEDAVEVLKKYRLQQCQADS